jgi:hypothetical protein
MIILWHLQLSAIDKNNGKFLTSKDSNFSVCSNIIKGLNQLDCTYRHHILVPDRIEFEKCDLPNTEFINYDYTTRVFSSRYDWNSVLTENIINTIKPDIIWENNPTLVNNWKTLLLEMKLIDKIKVVSYNHWIDTDAYPKIDRRCPYSFRQYEGALLSDLHMCNSLEAKNQILQSGLKLFNNVNRIPANRTITVPPFSFYEDILKNKVEKSENIKIIYNHRLSSLPYYNTAYCLFCEVINNIIDKLEKPIEIIFTDASCKLDNKDSIKINENEKCKVTLMRNLSKDDYYKLLWSCNICVGTFLPGNGGAWSISLYEGILTDNAVLVPDHAGYKEMVPFNFIGLIEPNLTDTSEKLLKLINNENWRNSNSEIAKTFFLENYDSTIICAKLDFCLRNLWNKEF